MGRARSEVSRPRSRAADAGSVGKIPGLWCRRGPAHNSADVESTRASEVARAPVAWLGPVAAGLLVSAAAGALVFSLWPVVGLPARGEPLDAPFLGSWRWFFAVWWPALFPAFTLVHERLVRRARALGRPDGVADRARRWDRWSYGLLPVFLVTMVAWQAVGGWRWTLATFYVVVLAGKVVAALVVEMRMRAAPPHPDRVPGDGASGSLVWLPFAVRAPEERRVLSRGGRRRPGSPQPAPGVSDSAGNL